MHYVTGRSHQMQRYKFGVTRPGVLFVESVPVSPDIKNSASTFYALDSTECSTSPTDPTGSQNKSSP
jgi:hypothetical protein